MRYTWFGLTVVPIPEARRRVVGGTAVDIRVDDPRSTVTSATVNAADVLDEQGRPFDWR